MVCAESRSIPNANPDWSDNWTHGAGTLHMEIMHVASRSVRLAQAAATGVQYDALAPPEGFAKTGIGSSVANLAYFPRSPGADRDGPLETIDVGGVRFSRVARPGSPEPGLRGRSRAPGGLVRAGACARPRPRRRAAEFDARCLLQERRLVPESRAAGAPR
jgi:hypothetical protein